jgi:hypothetical protein
MLGAGFHWVAIFKIADVPISIKLRILANTYLPNKIKVQALNESLYFKVETEKEMNMYIIKWIEDKYPITLQPKEIEIQFVSISSEQFLSFKKCL